MSNLAESSFWEPSIYQLATDDPVLGGEDGVANLQPSQLANRTQWLKAQVDQAQRFLNDLDTLQAATEPLDSVYVLGFAAPGDGGHAHYFPTGVITPGKAGTFDAATGTAYDSAGRAYQMLPPFNVRAFGAKGDDTTDDTDAIQGAVACAVLRHDWLNWDNSTYYVTETLTPNGQFFWNCASTSIRFDPTGTYTEMKKPDGTGISVHVCLDTINATDSTIQGYLSLIGAQPGGATRTLRAAVPDDTCAISASDKGDNGAGAQMTINALQISGFGYGLLQSDQNVGSYNILPYTRWNVSFLYIQFCHVPFQAGLSGTGFDDLRIDNLRLSRNFGRTYLTATRMNVGTFFDYGLNAASDDEPETVTTTAGNATATFSASMTGKLVAGDVVVIYNTSTTNGPDTNYLPSGKAMPWVGRVDSVSGTSVTFEENIPAAATACPWYYNPPYIEIQGGSSWISDHMFFEGIHRAGILVGSESRLVCQDVKVSTGEYAGAMGAIIILNRLRGGVAVHMAEKAERSNYLKRYVVVPMLAYSGEKSTHVVRVYTTVDQADFDPSSSGTLPAAPIELCALPEFLRWAAQTNDTGVKRVQDVRLIAPSGEYHHDGNLGYIYHVQFNSLGWTGHLNGASGEGYIRSLGTNVTTSSVPSTVNITAWSADPNAVWLMFGSRATATYDCAMVRVNNAADDMVIQDLGGTGGVFTHSGATLQYNQTAGSAGVVNIQGLRIA